MVRLFVAAWPTEAVSERIAGIERPAEPGVRWVPRRNWHITLRFLGDADQHEVADRLAAATLPLVTANLGPTIEPLGRRQIVIPAKGVEPLAGAVQSATAGLGPIEPRQFRGHLTLARLTAGSHSSMVGSPISDQFEITEIALAASELSPAGAVYTTIASFATS